MKKPVLRNGAIIQVVARRWFDKSAGNTYHSVQVTVYNGKNCEVFTENFKYGYDSQYMETAFSLIWAKFSPCKSVMEDENLWPKPGIPWGYTWKLKNHYKISETVTDVSRKKDLAF